MKEKTKKRKESYTTWLSRWNSTLTAAVKEFSTVPTGYELRILLSNDCWTIIQFPINPKDFKPWDEEFLQKKYPYVMPEGISLMIIKEGISLPDCLKNEPYKSMATVHIKSEIIATEKERVSGHVAPPFYWEEVQNIQTDCIILDFKDPVALSHFSVYLSFHFSMFQSLLILCLGEYMPKAMLSIIGDYWNPSPTNICPWKGQQEGIHDFTFFKPAIPNTRSAEENRLMNLMAFSELSGTRTFQTYKGRPGHCYIVFDNPVDFDEGCHLLNALGYRAGEYGYRKAAQANTIEIYSEFAQTYLAFLESNHITPILAPAI